MADVVGYSRLMGQDEDETIQRLKEFRQVFTDRISTSRGRVVNAPGDSILAEFTSVQEAVGSAVEIQRELAEKNADLPDDKRMLYRIGINLGDVVVEDDAIYGDGINVASRLEGLAEPGGITISGTVFESVRDKLPVSYEFTGEQQVKNIDNPVRAYKVLSHPGAGAPRVVDARRGAKLYRFRGLTALAVAVALIGAGAVAWLYWRPGDVTAPLTYRGLPTLAVLPFANLGGDPEQEYFADGITEELITLLAQFRDLSVIARNSMFTYKGKAVDVRQVGQEMGADFVLEGSVRRSAGHIRVTAQLLSAHDGKHIWAENYDRKLTTENLFALQDELAKQVAGVIAGAYGVISLSQYKESARKPPHALKSYECVLRAYEVQRMLTAESHLVARDCLERVVAADPHYAEAWAWLTMVYNDEYSLAMNRGERPLERAHKAIRQGIELDPSSPAVVMADAYYLFLIKDRRFMERAREAIAANPRDGFLIGFMGAKLFWSGQYDEGLELMDRSLELSPVVPGWYYHPYQLKAVIDGDHRNALAYAQKIDMPGWYFYHWASLVGYVGLNRMEEARREADLLLQAYPEIAKMAYYELRIWFWDDRAVQAYVEALRKVGLDVPPEETSRSIGNINGVLSLSPVRFAANAAPADTGKVGRAAQIQAISPRSPCSPGFFTAAAPPRATSCPNELLPGQRAHGIKGKCGRVGSAVKCFG